MIQRDTMHKARKPRECARCGSLVEPQQEYKRVKGRIGRVAYVYEFCSRCAYEMDDAKVQRALEEWRANR